VHRARIYGIPEEDPAVFDAMRIFPSGYVSLRRLNASW
jgi:hypothetical protein